MKCLFTIVFCSVLFWQGAFGQYRIGDRVKNVPIMVTLNNSQPVKSLADLQEEVTIVDFFGTWCKPCIKALPQLTELQQSFKNKVRFILVSNEAESVLSAFIEKRKPFTLPVVVDKQNEFTLAFQPVSYPYTVVLSKNGIVLALPSVAEMTAENITSWLSQSKTNTATANPKPMEPVTPQTAEPTLKASLSFQQDTSLLGLSQQFIYAAKTSAPTKQLQEQLYNLPYQRLVSDLDSDNKKKAFWINIYNGYTQILLRSDSTLYESRGKFFKAKQIDIAGKVFSLDKIEHGFLRRSKVKWSLGYFNRLFPGKTEKDLRVNKVDYRIHFALNCGAKSCPPIAFYNAAEIDKQLDVASKAYLSGEADYKSTENKVYLPAIMSWFRGDFGGKKHMVTLLHKVGVLPANVNPAVGFKKYDWDLFLENYQGEASK